MKICKGEYDIFVIRVCVLRVCLKLVYLAVGSDGVSTAVLLVLVDIVYDHGIAIGIFVNCPK